MAALPGCAAILSLTRQLRRPDLVLKGFQFGLGHGAGLKLSCRNPGFYRLAIDNDLPVEAASG